MDWGALVKKGSKPPMGTITFDLSDYDQREEFEACLKARRMKCQIDEVYTEVFRPYLRYDRSILGGELQNSERNILEAVWTKIRAHFEE